MKPMYQGLPVSPITVLTEAVNAADTIIHIEDSTVFPAPPNFATIGDIETIRYNAISVGILSGCERGVEGTSVIHTAGTKIARLFTYKDFQSLQENIRELDSSKQEKGEYIPVDTGNASMVTFADGESFEDKYQAGELTGKQGAPGQPGAPGPPGEKGADGLTTSITIGDQTFTHSGGNINLPITPYLYMEIPYTLPTSGYSSVTGGVRIDVTNASIKANSRVDLIPNSLSDLDKLTALGGGYTECAVGKVSIFLKSTPISTISTTLGVFVNG